MKTTTEADMTKDALYPRTHGEALLDLDYKIAMCARHERFYGRVHRSIALLSLIAGSAAFASIFKPNAAVVTGAGALIAALSFANQVWKYADGERMHRDLFRKFMAVRRRAGELTVEQLDAEIIAVDAETVPMIQGLAAPTFNENLRAHGFNDTKWHRPLTWWNRVWDVIA